MIDVETADGDLLCLAISSDDDRYNGGGFIEVIAQMK